MAIQFVPCKACGKPQRSDRNICMFCHANITTGEMPPDKSDEDQEHLIEKIKARRKISPWIIGLFICFVFLATIAYYVKPFPGKAAPRQSAEKRQLKVKHLAPPKNAVAIDAIKALKKIRAATSVGVTFMEYSRLTIEAKAMVDDALEVLPDGELKTEIYLAMEVYADVIPIWNSKYALSTFTRPGNTLIPKYSIPTNEHGVELPDVTLHTLWRVGRERIKRASQLIE